MRRLLLILVFIIASETFSLGQKVDLEKWVSHTVDSLRNEKVDTIEYYHSYCGECWIRQKPHSKTDTLPKHICDVGNSWVQIKNLLIYKQKSKYYFLTFNCGYPPIKTEIKNAKSPDYFLSIVPVLYKRDKYEAAMRKKHKFFLPLVIDGGYEEAFIYCNHIKQSVYMQDYQKTDKTWLSFFWMKKHVQLMKLLENETSAKN